MDSALRSEAFTDKQINIHRIGNELLYAIGIWQNQSHLAKAMMLCILRLAFLLQSPEVLEFDRFRKIQEGQG